jgi:beta-glucosidase
MTGRGGRASRSAATAYPRWRSNAPTSGGDILATFPHLNDANGALNNHVSLYADTVSLLPGKTIKYLTLPDVGPR